MPTSTGIALVVIAFIILLVFCAYATPFIIDNNRHGKLKNSMVHFFIKKLEGEQ